MCAARAAALTRRHPRGVGSSTSACQASATTRCAATEALARRRRLASLAAARHATHHSQHSRSRAPPRRRRCRRVGGAHAREDAAQPPRRRVALAVERAEPRAAAAARARCRRPPQRARQRGEAVAWSSATRRAVDEHRRHAERRAPAAAATPAGTARSPRRAPRRRRRVRFAPRARPRARVKLADVVVLASVPSQRQRHGCVACQNTRSGLDCCRPGQTGGWRRQRARPANRGLHARDRRDAAAREDEDGEGGGERGERERGGREARAPVMLPANKQEQQLLLGCCVGQWIALGLASIRRCRPGGSPSAGRLSEGRLPTLGSEGTPYHTQIRKLRCSATARLCAPRSSLFSL